jgi:hypothetical protein
MQPALTLRELVQEFLGKQQLNHSQQWEDTLVERYQARISEWRQQAALVEDETPVWWVRLLYEEMQQELLTKCKKWLLRKFPEANADDIVHDAYIKLEKGGLPEKILKEKEPELRALMQITKTTNIDTGRKSKKEQQGYKMVALKETIQTPDTDHEEEEEQNGTKTINLGGRLFMLRAFCEVRNYYLIARGKVIVTRLWSLPAHLAHPETINNNGENRVEFRRLHPATLFYKERLELLKSTPL